MSDEIKRRGYTHLHFHTEYSLLDGANKIKNVAKRIKELGMTSVAMTDHGNMFGAIDFYQTMEREGIKPIIGIEAYIHNGEFGDRERGMWHVCLYAKDEIGYKNLMYLSSQSFLNYYYQPRIPKSLLKQHTKGLVCTSACLAGEVNFHLNNTSEKNINRGAEGYDKAKEVALEYKEMFGDDYYLEIMRHGIDHQEKIDNDLIKLSKETGIKLVATNDTHYTFQDDSEAHEVFMCIGTGATWDDPKRLRHSVHEFYIKSPEEMDMIFADIPEAIDATNEIADKCNLKLNLGNPTPPNFKFTIEYARESNLELPDPENRFSFKNDAELFAYKCREGLEERLKIVPKEDHQRYRNRLEHEIGVINEMNFPGYMLIVWDFVRASEERDIPVGPGRGCLTKEALVYTVKDGRVNIKNINKVSVGDRVITHRNSIKKVTKTFKYSVKEELYRVETVCGDYINPIVLTGDHKIYLGNGEWREAQHIKEDNWLYLPIPKYVENEIKEFDLKKYGKKGQYNLKDREIVYRFSKDHQDKFTIQDLALKTGESEESVVEFFKYLNGKKVKLKEEITNSLFSEILKAFESLEEWRNYIDKLNLRRAKRYIKNDLYFQKFLGRWIGGGYLNRDLNIKDVSISLNESDKDGLFETEMFANSNGYQFTKTINGDRVSIHIHDRFLHSFFRDIFKGYKFHSNSKYIPTFIFNLPKEDIRNILDGYISSDGKMYQDRVEIDTLSKNLAYQIRTLLLQIGIPSSLKEESREVNLKKFKTESRIFSLTIPIYYSFKSVPNERQNIYRVERDHIRLKVSKVEKLIKEKRSVYDFSVKDDHSYTTTNFTVHNSAAGSLVAFSLKITDIDPMKYDLLFERFLNPERISMPDIDMDFAQNKRKEIIKYVQDQYGKENVAQVITFNSLLAKGVIRDVSRVFGVIAKETNEFAKLIPNELGITLEKALEMEPKIGELLQNDTRFQKIWDISKALEGLKRNTGIHAAGLVISNEALWNKTPIYVSNKDEDQNFVTQYSLNYLEDVDLIKFDFLGLKTLDVIYGAIKLIKAHKGVDIDWHQIDVNDKKVYDFMSSGKTIGMFQIESSGMQELNRRMKPSNFEDVIALIALYRPGPMDSGMLDDFVDRKHGTKKVSYPFEGKEFPEQLKEILDPTYGVIVYQEQVMQIVQKIGGFSLGKSDIVRRAMGKKKIDLMKEYKSQFADGAEEQGLDRKIAEELFDLIEKFAGYGFNKSHSAAYAMITFQTAYLKTYYPAEFMAALLSTENDNMIKIALYVNEAKSMKIGILPPDIQESQKEFSVIKKRGKEYILFGLGAVKGVGGAALESMLEARKSGRFRDFADFLNRVDSQKVNKKVLEALIKAGAFNSLKVGDATYNRKTLLDGIDEILEYGQEVSKLKKSASSGLFEEDDEFAVNNRELMLTPREDYSLKEILEIEKETMNFYISGHPLDEYKEKLKELENISKIGDIEKFNNWQEVVFVVIFEIIEIKISKKSGNRYAPAKMIDYTGEYTTTLFSKTLKDYEALPDDLKSGAVGVKCQVRMNDEEKRELFIKEFFSIDEVSSKSEKLNKGNKFKPKPKVDPVDEVIEMEEPLYITDCILRFDQPVSQKRLDNLIELAKGSLRGQRRLLFEFPYEGKIFSIDTQLGVNSSFEKIISEKGVLV